jgi:hypothetical protein
MIKELYLKRAATIRRDYTRILTQLNNHQLAVAQTLTYSISNRKKELEELLEKLDQKKFKTPDEAQMELNEIVVQTEDDFNKIDASINKLVAQIDKLREDEINLYKEIKTTYYQLSDDEIRKEVQDYIKKLNLS